MHRNMVAFVKRQLPTYYVEDKLIEAMGESLSYICMGVLEAKTDEFEGKLKKLSNFHEYIQEEKAKGEITTDEGVNKLIDEAKGSRSYIFEFSEKIPLSQYLYIANITPRTASRNPNIRKYLQTGFLIVCVWIDRVLKQHYKAVSKAKRIQIYADMLNWIDSYQKKYQSNKGICELYREDLNYNILDGEHYS